MLSQLAHDLHHYENSVRRVLDAYQDHGPGGVADRLYEAVRLDRERLMSCLETFPVPETVDERCLRAAIDDTDRLAKQCATTSSGLCFVTGESGLIPRPELLAKYQDGLQALAAATHQAIGRTTVPPT